MMKLKGYLRPVILKLLNDEDNKTGSELAEEIEERIGSKPSYGSIYPILQKLVEKKLLEVEEDGKKKKYSLTKKGEQFVMEMEEKKREQTENFLSMLRTFKTIYEDKDIELLIENIEKKKGENPPHFPELSQIHHLLITSEVEGKEEEIREALKQAFENVERILEDEP